jgi:TonB family protein
VEEKQLEHAADLLRNLLSVFPKDPILEKDLRSVLSAASRKGDGGGTAPIEAEPEAAELPAEWGDSPSDASRSVAALSVDIQPLVPAAKPQLFEIVRAPLEIAVTSWRRPALFTVVVLSVAASVALPAWRISRRQQSVALASSAPARSTQVSPRTAANPLPGNASAENAPLAKPEPRVSRTAASAIAAESAHVAKAITPAPAQKTASITDKAAAAADPKKPLATFALPSGSVAAPSRPAAVLPPPPGTIQETPVTVANTLPAVSPVAGPPPLAPKPAIPDPGPSPARPERVGGNFQPPQLISGPGVVVPALARGRKLYGAVQLQTTINKEGAVSNVTIVGGDPILAQAARQAVLLRRYRPAMLDGEPLEVKVPIQVVFQPER